MYINSISYMADLIMRQQFKKAMQNTIYPKYLGEIGNLINNKVDCLDVVCQQCPPYFFEIRITIKKTTMRRCKGYSADSLYYYNLMNEVFDEFFTNNPEAARSISAIYGLSVEWLYHNFTGLCDVNCIGDKLVTIRL